MVKAAHFMVLGRKERGKKEGGRGREGGRGGEKKRKEEEEESHITIP